MRLPAAGTRDRRALLIGAAIIAPALLWKVAVAPYLGAVADARARLASERALLERELELLAASALYPAAIERAAALLIEAAPRLFAADNPTVASAELAGYVQEVARSSRVLLTRVEPRPAEPGGTGLVALPLDIEGETDLEGLMTFLRRVESGPRRVRIDDLRIDGLRAAAARPSDGSETLGFTLTARGYMLDAGPAVAADSDAAPRRQRP